MKLTFIAIGVCSLCRSRASRPPDGSHGAAPAAAGSGAVEIPGYNLLSLAPDGQLSGGHLRLTAACASSTPSRSPNERVRI